MVDLNWIMVQAGGAFFTIVVAPIATVVAALIGGWYGADRALSKYKEQRGFDRRIEWYEQTIKMLRRITVEGNSAEESARKLDRDRLFQQLDKLAEASTDFEFVLAQAGVYAGPQSRPLIAKVLKRLEAFEVKDPETSENPREWLIGIIGSLRNEVEQLSIVLEQECRAYLKLE